MQKPIESAFLLAALFISTAAAGQTVNITLNPHASYVDVNARRGELKHTRSERIRAAIADLKTCSALPMVDPPLGPIKIPMHYLAGGHGAINPAEHLYTAVYGEFELRVTAGMNQYLVTGSHKEAQCAQDQIDKWAQANTLLDYEAADQKQSWFQVEWTLASVSTSESVLVSDSRLDKAETARDIAWMDKVAHRMIGFPEEKVHQQNHHYWRGLGAIATGVVASDQELFDFGVQAYKDGVNEIDQRGAFPKEMARVERAIHYQSFALQPLVTIAAFAERQNVPLYSYTSPTGHTIADAINFFGEIVADPSIVKAYTPENQLIDSDAPDFFADLEFYTHRFPDRKLPESLVNALKKPTFATRLGGSTTVLAGR
ncbi:MAG TPA: alginate lyase family protein [Terracidiphilus sp.]|nr:alginate lyase family protein [Terracidiphilus sp.]